MTDQTHIEPPAANTVQPAKMVLEYSIEDLTLPCTKPRYSGISGDILEDECPLDNGKITRSPQKSMGKLEDLPMKLLHRILVDLDLQALTTFRCVNLCAMATVDAIPEYHAIVTHQPNLLRATLSVQTAQFVSCRTLFDAFSRTTCETCGDVGAYIYLITGIRVCQLCLEEDVAYHTVPWLQAKFQFEVLPEVLETLPHSRIPPIGSGIERLFNATVEGRVIDLRFLRTVIQKSSDAAQISRWNSQYSGYYRIDTDGPERPLMTKRLSRTFATNSIKEATSIDMSQRSCTVNYTPFFDRTKQTTEWGFRCMACKNLNSEGPLDPKRRFVKSSFEDHMIYDHGGIDCTIKSAQVTKRT